jgi:hypothetical protein
MNSPFANLYIDLQKRIAAYADDIAHIAPDVGQLSAKSRPPVSWPCALIDFEDFTFTNLGRNVQVAAGTVLIKLGFAPHTVAAQDTPDEYRDAAIGYYDIEWELHKALQGWSPTNEHYGSLCRTSVTTQRRSDSYRVRELRYSISFDDYSTQPVLDYVPAELVVGLEMGG